MKRAISSFIVLPLLLIGFGSLQGATLLDDAVAYWGFEGNLDGTHSINLVDVSGTTTGMIPTIVPAFNPVSGIKAVNAGTQAVAFDGTNVLKSNSASLRIGGAQTLWLRVNLGSIPADTVALMTRSRPVNSQRGISLQMTNGRLQGYLSADGTTYNTQLTSSSSYVLQASSWYDISMRFDPSNVLRIDLYDPMTGTLLDSMETTTNVPASISTSNSIGSGYFQVGSINNGGAGSSYLVPNGTLIESAAVWNSYLSDDQIRTLSAVPEPRSISMLMMGGASLAMILRLSRAR